MEIEIVTRLGDVFMSLYVYHIYISTRVLKNYKFKKGVGIDHMSVTTKSKEISS